MTQMLLAQTTTATLREVTKTPAAVTWTYVPGVRLSTGVRFDRGRQGEGASPQAGRATFTTAGEPLARGDVIRFALPPEDTSPWLGTYTSRDADLTDYASADAAYTTYALADFPPDVVTPLWTGIITEASRRWEGGLRLVTTYTAVDVLASLNRTILEALPVAELATVTGTTAVIFDTVHGRLAAGDTPPHFSTTTIGLPTGTNSLTAAATGTRFNGNTATDGLALIAPGTASTPAAGQATAYTILCRYVRSAHTQTLLSLRSATQPDWYLDLAIDADQQIVATSYETSGLVFTDGIPDVDLSTVTTVTATDPIPGAWLCVQIFATATDVTVAVNGQPAATLDTWATLNLDAGAAMEVMLGASLRFRACWTGDIFAYLEHVHTPAAASTVELLTAATYTTQLLDGIPEPTDQRAQRILHLAGYTDRNTPAGTLTGGSLGATGWTLTGTFTGLATTLTSGQSAALLSPDIETGGRVFQIRVAATVTTSVLVEATVTTGIEPDGIDNPAGRYATHTYYGRLDGDGEVVWNVRATHPLHMWAQVGITLRHDTGGAVTTTITGGGVYVVTSNQTSMHAPALVAASAAAHLGDAAAAESSTVTITAAGSATVPSATSRINTTAAVTVPADCIDSGTRIETSDRYTANSITAEGPDGDYLAVDAASVAVLGEYHTRIEVPAASSAWVEAAALSALRRGLRQTIDAPDISINTTAVAATINQRDLLTCDLGDVIALTSFPTDAPAASFDVFVEGLSWQITPGQWLLGINTSLSPADRSGWVVGTSTLGTSTLLGDH